MTISEQLHRSKTHKAGSDPACPTCAKPIANWQAFCDAMNHIHRELDRLEAQLKGRKVKHDETTV